MPPNYLGGFLFTHMFHVKHMETDTFSVCNCHIVSKIIWSVFGTVVPLYRNQNQKSNVMEIKKNHLAVGIVVVLDGEVWGCSVCALYESCPNLPFDCTVFDGLVHYEAVGGVK